MEGGGGGASYNQGLEKKNFLTVSLHISIMFDIRTPHTSGHVFNFKTLDLGSFQTVCPKARKSSASKFIKEKIKNMKGHSLGPRAAKAFNFYFK
jgi:hypothetical protein